MRFIINTQTTVYRACEHESHKVTRAKRSEYLLETEDGKLIVATCHRHLPEFVQRAHDSFLSIRLENLFSRRKAEEGEQ